MPWLEWKGEKYCYELQEVEIPNSLQIVLYCPEKPYQKLFIDILENASMMVGFSEFFIEKSIASIIEYALKKEWKTKKEELFLRIDSHQVRLVKRSLREEAAQVDLFLSDYPKLLEEEQLKIAKRLEKLSEKWRCPLPSYFYFLYTRGGACGGFGHDYGFLPIEGKLDWEREDFGMWSLYKEFLADEPYPRQLVPFLHWGGLIFSAIDCSLPKHSVWVIDFSARQKKRPWVECLWKHEEDFSYWLEQWIAAKDNGRKMWLEMFEMKK